MVTTKESRGQYRSDDWRRNAARRMTSRSHNGSKLVCGCRTYVIGTKVAGLACSKCAEPHKGRAESMQCSMFRRWRTAIKQPPNQVPLGVYAKSCTLVVSPCLRCITAWWEQALPLFANVLATRLDACASTGTVRTHSRVQYRFVNQTQSGQLRAGCNWPGDADSTRSGRSSQLQE